MDRSIAGVDESNNFYQEIEALYIFAIENLPDAFLRVKELFVLFVVL